MDHDRTSFPSDVHKHLMDACGPLPIPMTNDYLFRTLMQENKTVLSALVCSLLRLNPQAVTDLTVLNPIVPGRSIREKEYILDVKLELNRHTLINLELQVINYGDWPERSLCYLCRNFDNLNRGDNYKDVRPAVQIGILDFTPFEDAPGFLSDYYIMNTKNHKIYSDKFRLTVLDLTQRNLATKEDRAYKTDLWASLFKATTWEELKMLAKADSGIQEAVVTIHKLTLTEKIRLKCEAREEYRRHMRWMKAQVQQAEAERDRLLRLLQAHNISVEETSPQGRK